MYTMIKLISNNRIKNIHLSLDNNFNCVLENRVSNEMIFFGDKLDIHNKKN